MPVIPISDVDNPGLCAKHLREVRDISDRITRAIEPSVRSEIESKEGLEHLACAYAGAYSALFNQAGNVTIHSVVSGLNLSVEAFEERFHNLIDELALIILLRVSNSIDKVFEPENSYVINTEDRRKAFIDLQKYIKGKLSQLQDGDGLTHEGNPTIN